MMLKHVHLPLDLPYSGSSRPLTAQPLVVLCVLSLFSRPFAFGLLMRLVTLCWGREPKCSNLV